MNNYLGKTIRILRNAKSIPLNVLAKKAGISTSFLSLIESGDRQPSIKVIRGIADGLSIPSDMLILSSMDNDSELSSGNLRVNELSSNVDQLIKLEKRLGILLEKGSG
ncbi:MAG: helix-turn-helix transcriptional regulator [Planctomycetaceae bacterium]